MLIIIMIYISRTYIFWHFHLPLCSNWIVVKETVSAKYVKNVQICFDSIILLISEIN